MITGFLNKKFHTSERFGLAMIAASLFAIALILGLLIYQQRTSAVEEIRTQGSGTALTLSRFSLEQLAPASGASEPLLLVGQLHSNRWFSYAAVTDLAGATLSATTAPGMSVPAPPAANGQQWSGERRIEGDAYDRLEFFQAVKVNNDVQAYIRIGYRMPGLPLSTDQIPFYAILAFIIFSLTPLFYFLIKREMAPLAQLKDRLSDMLDDDAVRSVSLTPSPELSDFMSGFNTFIREAEQRVMHLKNEQAQTLATTKILTYKKARIEAVLDAFPDAVLVLDELGTVSFANRKIEGILGFSREQAIDKRINEWRDNDKIVNFLSRYQRKPGKLARSDSIQITVGEQPPRQISVNAYPLPSTSDQHSSIGTLVVFRDVSDVDLARQAASEFVAQVSHELKSPLNVINMYSEMLSSEEGCNEDLRVESINAIHDQVERLSGLINNLLSLTRIEMGTIPPNRQRVKLRELLMDVYGNILSSGRAEQLQMEIDIPHELSPVMMDKDLFRIAINNLLTNAVKYNRPQGKVVFSAQETDQEIVISVRDTGLGISPDDQQKIFQKFYRAESDEVQQRPGHGLGLALTKEIIELHQGKLDLHSEPGSGSEFSIHLRKNTAILKQAV